MKKISIFRNIKTTKNGQDVILEDFLQQIKEGAFQDEVLKVRNAKSKEEYNEYKRTILPYATISGTFAEKNNKGLKTHSGFIAIDIDNIAQDESQQIRRDLEHDKYSYSVFTSCGGFGLVVLVKIDGKKHREAFEALESYYYKHYNIIIDTSCKDVSRARFVSYDPELFINHNSLTYNHYLPKKPKAETQPEKFIFANSDIERCVKQLQDNQIDIVKGDYQRWLNVGFGLADALGESGRELFHAVSQYDGKYDSKQCDKQFDKCLKAKNTGITIATFFYYCKEENIKIVSENTIKIAASAMMGKKGSQSKESTIETIKTLQNIETDVEEIVEKVFLSNDIKNVKLKSIDEIELFITNSYNNMRFNDITRRLELDEQNIDERAMNDIWRNINKIAEKDISFEAVKRVLTSQFIESYNPIQNWFESQEVDVLQRGHIKKLADCIETDTGYNENNFYPQYSEEVIKRWLVGLAAMVYGSHSPLMLMLVGTKQGTGKTEFFRRLLPQALQRYYAESKLDAGKDDFILMCEMLIILNDEYEGRTVNDEKLLKQLLSKQNFTLRAPYGSFNETRKRLAALAGTSNEEQVLKDSTGNRRLLPIKVLSIDFDKYNSIDKTKLFIEAYQLFKSGYDWEVKGEFLKALNDNTEGFDSSSSEADLILKFYTKPASENDSFVHKLTSTDIKEYIEKETKQNLSRRKIGLELKRLGYEQKIVKVEGTPKRVYFMKYREVYDSEQQKEIF